jgi:hypothetical protein
MSGGSSAFFGALASQKAEVIAFTFLSAEPGRKNKQPPAMDSRVKPGFSIAVGYPAARYKSPDIVLGRNVVLGLL